MAEDFIQLISKGQLTSAQDARFWQASSSRLPGLRPDSDSSRDFGSSKVYPRENWAILKKNELGLLLASQLSTALYDPLLGIVTVGSECRTGRPG